jgi:hypothetical protein
MHFNPNRYHIHRITLGHFVPGYLQLIAVLKARDVFQRIPQISVSFAPIQMKPRQIFQANSSTISDRKKPAKMLYIG